MAETQSDVAVVTGANSGIGRAVALHLAAQGLSVYGTVRNSERATKLQGMAAEAGVEVNLVELDVADTRRSRPVSPASWTRQAVSTYS